MLSSTSSPSRVTVSEETTRQRRPKTVNSEPCRRATGAEIRVSCVLPSGYLSRTSQSTGSSSAPSGYGLSPATLRTSLRHDDAARPRVSVVDLREHPARVVLDLVRHGE